jgi:hypothetical protein
MRLISIGPGDDMASLVRSNERLFRFQRAAEAALRALDEGRDTSEITQLLEPILFERASDRLARRGVGID